MYYKHNYRGVTASQALTMSLNLKTAETIQDYRVLFKEWTKLPPSEVHMFLSMNPDVLAHVKTPNPEHFRYRFDARKSSDWHVLCSALDRYFTAKAQPSSPAPKSPKYIIVAKNNATPASKTKLYYTGIRGFSLDLTDAKAWTLETVERHLDQDCIQNLLAAGLIAQVEILELP